MTVKQSDRVRNAVANATTSTIAAASTLASAAIQLRTGAAPASCASPATGTLLGSAPILSPGYMSAASGGSASMASTISGVCSAAGTVGHYRIVAGDGGCDEQGSVTLTGGGGDATISAASLAVVIGQPFTFSARSLVAANG